jgi:hypothetical protein
MWKREVSLIIQPKNTDKGIEIGELHFEFDIERSILFGDNTAEFRIYNLNPDTRAAIEDENSAVQFKAGYADVGVGMLFYGEIYQAIHAKTENEWVTTLQCAMLSGDIMPMDSVITCSYPPRTKVSVVLQNLCDILGLSFQHKDNLSYITFENGFTACKNARSIFKDIEKYVAPAKLGFFIDNHELTVYKKGGEVSTFGGIMLSPATGLLHCQWKQEKSSAGFQTYKHGEKRQQNQMQAQQIEADKRKYITATTTLIPSLRPNSVITVRDGIHDEDGEGYLIEKMRISGDNFGGEFTMEIEASK